MVTAIVTVVMFVVMVSLHELGHFLVGRLFNFKILEYAIGFGPVIWKKQGKETQYSLRAVPLGGFCKFAGEDEESDDPRAFGNMAGWKRILVTVAGGLVNIVLGFILFIIIVTATSPDLTNVVDSVVPNSYIEEQGILPGDKIIKINGKNVSFYQDIALYTSDFTENTEAEIMIKRGNEKKTINVKPTKQTVEATYTQEGILYKESINGVSSERVIPYSDENQLDKDKLNKTETTTRYIIGFSPKKEDVTFFNVWGEAFNYTKFVVKLVYQSLWDLITGKMGVDQMSGPVGIVSEVNNAVNSGSQSWLYVLNLVALLSINLGVFNLLPFPALDGGRIFFMIVEIIRRKPIPPEKEGMVHFIGMALLMLLVVFVSYHDIMKLIGA